MPALTTVCTRSARPDGTRWAIAWASGGDARPVLDPAITTPTVSTAVVGASAMSPVPVAAHRPAATATARAPHRAAAAVEVTIATQ